MAESFSCIIHDLSRVSSAGEKFYALSLRLGSYFFTELDLLICACPGCLRKDPSRPREGDSQ